ncbi:class I SAM-dependent DNA methyltransferase [Providencia rettgeri]|uniref:HsdM family class I SAM-dependent methyltransferase n=1 Tax=Providencia sp. PROV270 TaxID=2949958 RepID=UPI00234B0B78|nr:N-6 DNA methylase [Providencia sp. PROV270]
MMSVIGDTSKKSLGRYFTREMISDLLISSLSVNNPCSVLDLGSGDGSLSRSAAKRWNSAIYHTVDILNQTRLSKSHEKVNNHKHYLLDALEPTLFQEMGVIPEAFDLALCNPPFIRPKWKNKHLELLISSGYSEDIHAVTNVSAEVLFVIQNLISLKNGGQLGLIIPDGFVSGENNKDFRRFLLSKNSINKVIKLPKNSFVGTNIQAHILIITKGVISKNIILESFDPMHGIVDAITISKDDGIKCLDYSYHKDLNSGKGSYLTLEELGAEVIRGKSNSRQCKESKYPILHLDKIIDNVEKINLFSCLKDNYLPSNEVVANSGDILLARVGRNLSKKITLVTYGEMAISDCIYKIVVPIKWRTIVFEYLCSEAGRASLMARTRGTGARYLTKSMLLSLPIRHVKLAK